MSMKLKHLCSAPRKPPDQAHLRTLQEEDINTCPPEADGNQEVLGFSPAPFSMEESCTLSQGRWLFGTQVHCLLQIKSLFLAPTTRFISLSCGEQ